VEGERRIEADKRGRKKTQVKKTGLKAQGLIYVPPRSTLKTLHLVLSAEACQCTAILSLYSLRGLVVPKDADGVLCNVWIASVQ